MASEENGQAQAQEDDEEDPLGAEAQVVLFAASQSYIGTCAMQTSGLLQATRSTSLLAFRKKPEGGRECQLKSVLTDLVALAGSRSRPLSSVIRTTWRSWPSMTSLMPRATPIC